MRGLGYLALSAITGLLVFASPFAAFAQDSATDMAARQKSEMIICAATHRYLDQDISVRRLFKRDGTEIMDNDLDRKESRADDDEMTGEIRRQLFDYVTGMVKTRDKDCSPHDPYDGNEIHVFDCSSSWQDGDNLYSVSNKAASWRFNDGGEWRLSIDWYGFDENKDKVGWSGLSVTQPYSWQIPNVSKEKSSQEFWIKFKSAQVRVGENVFRPKSIANNVLFVPPTEWSKLMQGQGDIEITFYGKNRRHVLQKTFPHTFLADIEENLKTEFRKITQKARDNLVQCKRLDSWEGGEDQMIVVT